MSRLVSTEVSQQANVESALLVCCARTSLDQLQAARLAELLRRDIDWQRLLPLANLHGLIPLLRLHVRQNTAVPTAIEAQLERAAGGVTQYNLLLALRLLKVLTIFEQAALVAVPFKGPLLAALAYQGLSLRQFGDLDLFVREHDLTAARCALRKHGYREDERFPTAAGQQRAFLRAENHLVLHSPDNIPVELHWNVTPRWRPVRIDLDRLWQRVQYVWFADRKVPSFSPEDLLVLLSVHGAKHQWRRIGWICDVAELIRSYPRISWEQVQSEASRAGASRIVRLGLFLAADVLSAELPPAVARWARADTAVASLAFRIVSRHAVDLGDAPDTFELERFHFAVRDRWRDKLRYAIGRVTTPRILEWSLLPLPSRLAFLYSIVRPARLLFAYSAKVLHWRRTP